MMALLLSMVMASMVNTELGTEHREMNCNMDFKRYPMDEQICHFKVLSGSYGLPKLVRGLDY